MDFCTKRSLCVSQDQSRSLGPVSEGRSVGTMCRYGHHSSHSRMLDIRSTLGDSDHVIAIHHASAIGGESSPRLARAGRGLRPKSPVDALRQGTGIDRAMALASRWPLVAGVGLPDHLDGLRGLREFGRSRRVTHRRVGSVRRFSNKDQMCVGSLSPNR